MSRLFGKAVNIFLTLLIITSFFLVDFSKISLFSKSKFTSVQGAQQGVSMYLDNSFPILTAGSIFYLDVKLDSPQSGMNAVQADISYDFNMLEVTKIDTSNSIFPLSVINSASDGDISIVRGSFSPIEGNGLQIARIQFKALKEGKTDLSFKESSAAVNSQVDSLESSPELELNIVSQASPSPSALPSSTPPTPSPSSTPTPIPTPIPNSKSRITIFAAGSPLYGVYPTMKLEIYNAKSKKWKVVKTWKNIKGNPELRKFKEFSFVSPSPILSKDVRVRFTNDGYRKNLGDRNLIIDKINIDGVDFQTEDETVFSKGSWDLSTGCKAGFKKSETLACNGYIQYP